MNISEFQAYVIAYNFLYAESVTLDDRGGYPGDLQVVGNHIVSCLTGDKEPTLRVETLDDAADISDWEEGLSHEEIIQFIKEDRYLLDDFLDGYVAYLLDPSRHYT